MTNYCQSKFERPALFIISGPSGVGKSTIVQGLLGARPEIRLKRSITVTTRVPRKQEKEGIDYYFVSEKDFLEKLKKKEFLEYADVHGAGKYGSLRSDVDKILKSGSDALLVIDTQGMEQVIAQKHAFKVVTIFIAPQSLFDLERRLTLRGTDSSELIKRRLQTAQREMAKMHKYDHIVESKTPAHDLSVVLEIYKRESKLGGM